MALVINIKGKYHGLVPNVLSQFYRFRPFEDEVLTAQFKGGASKSVNVSQQLQDAWGFITQRANIPGGKCNAYFKTLPRRKTLKEVLLEDDIVVHCLEPKGSHSYDDLPYADTAGRDIGLDPTLLFETSRVLACTLIHELAHVAGATTNKSDPDAGAAEESLRHCLCESHFHLGTLGTIETVQESASRVV